MAEVLHTRKELAAAREAMTGTVGVVMTMGALHAGHEMLLRAARERADHVIVTIFVNPLQFGPNEDFDRYPRTLDTDLEICRRVGVDAVFAPPVAEMYPEGQPTVRLNPGPLGEDLEGLSRPGFFHGVLTVVMKLLQLTQPDLAFFGEKDYQQLTLVRRMVRDLDVPTEIVGVPTVREPDGLALSSRNRYLSAAEREAALSLSVALRAGAAAAERGEDAGAVLAAAHRAFDNPAARLDYLVLTDTELEPGPVTGPARLLIAAWVGATRLIDNTAIHLAPRP
ncbi:MULTISPECIES: pantoate--beta-alanine ligase [Micromonospora]|uniref:pantoate--beta-alanine ligase n=1 Tax=Micromonospora TaxID=1873 RepID=UPI0003EEAABD|nr:MULTISPECIES: pantoate--beta-alanine ligase [Micromonospora]EWM67116.1 pantoate--beta-alanine ligase [Micromonospora sp. M42]MBC8994725.1 pantoate--beta-alanine ligase [Micromonospora chalcea]MBP1786046.1 pantoate--beta-alanine ligase [Micromonospora sp. HB375]MBQ1066903.1 pantoate--beta-alanine ligase [Micromonospora sp. D75]MCK1810317.1 pantoate--beta-alanine ligase [Micromonospora sp. R42106]